MIPTIGLMVGAYIVLRCAELATLPDAHFSSRVAAGVVRVLAMLTAAQTVYCIAELMRAGSAVQIPHG